MARVGRTGVACAVQCTVQLSFISKTLNWHRRTATCLNVVVLGSISGCILPVLYFLPHFLFSPLLPFPGVCVNAYTQAEQAYLETVGLVLLRALGGRHADMLTYAILLVFFLVLFCRLRIPHSRHANEMERRD